ncbi:CD1375 family protein [Mediterraneibacter glycyrrhizinilyticus]|nr:CD1375 family protein [Mediterraneibacter glycyrrhizinilyticus]
MVVFYVMKINDGTITIDDVPEKWREKVRAEIEIQNMLEGE